MASDEEDIVETKYSRENLVFSFQVSKRDWWDVYDPGVGKSMKGGWQELLKDEFLAHKPEGVHCSLYTKGNSIVRLKEGDDEDRKRGNPFNGRLACTSETVCNMVWFFMIEKFSELRQEKITINVYGKGLHKHSSKDPVRAAVRGKKRDEIKKLLAVKSAAEVNRDLLSKKNSTPRGAADLAAGNFDGSPSNGALRQMAREETAKGDLHKDPWVNLKLHADAINKDYGRNTVFDLSDTPFRLAWATDNMMKLLYSGSKSNEPLIVGFDSTGSLVSPVEWDALKRSVYLYSLVMKDKDSAPIGITEMVLNDHHEYEIAILFPRLLARYQNFVREKYHTTPRFLPFTAVVIDMSWAMTNALLQEVVGMSLVSYLHACIAAKEDQIVRFTLILWCYAHFIHGITRKVGTCVPVKKKRYSPARRCLKFAMAEIARTDTVKDAVDLFRSVAIIFSSEVCTDQVTLNLKILADKFSMTLDDLGNEEDAHKYMENPDENPDIPIFIPEEDRACSNFTETYKDSPFYKKFKDVYNEIIFELPDEESQLEKNPFYVPEVVPYLLRYLMPFYAFWSRFLQSLIMEGENPLTNSAVELSFKLKKQETWVRKKYHKAARFLVRTVEDTEKRLLKHQFNTDFKKYTTSKKRPIAGNEELEDDQDDEEPQKDSAPGPPAKKVCQEGWKESKSLRPPHGHYSKANAKLYSAKLIKRSKDLQSERLNKSKASQSTMKKNGKLIKKFRLPVRKTQLPTSPDPENTGGDRPPPPPTTPPPDYPPAPSPPPDCPPRPPSPPADDADKLPNKRRSSLNVTKPPEGEAAPWLKPPYAHNGNDDSLFGPCDRQTQSLAPGRLVDGLCLDTLGDVLQKKTQESGLCFTYISPTLLKDGLEVVGAWALKQKIILSDIWMVPIHSASRVHWSLLLVNLKDRKLVCIDSLGVPSLTDKDLYSTIAIIMGLISFLAKKILYTRVNWPSWTLHQCLDVPHQPNGFDCGVIVAVFMTAICGLTNEPYTELHSTKIRRWIAENVMTADTIDLDTAGLANEVKGIERGDPSQLPTQIAPPSSSTWSYVIGLTKALYSASTTHCAVGEEKCSPIEDEDMVYCAGARCRDFYHLSCIKDKRKNIPEIFKCRECKQPHLKTSF